MKLKPCPFCGCDKLDGPHPADSSWWIECQKCEITLERDSKHWLIKDWNKRDTTSLHKLVKKWEQYELPGEYESLYKDLKELLKGGE